MFDCKVESGRGEGCDFTGKESIVFADGKMVKVIKTLPTGYSVDLLFDAEMKGKGHSEDLIGIA